MTWQTSWLSPRFMGLVLGYMMNWVSFVLGYSYTLSANLFIYYFLLILNNLCFFRSEMNLKKILISRRIELNVDIRLEKWSCNNISVS